jgi:protein-disulfide isomerase
VPVLDRIFAAPQALDPKSLRAHAKAIGLDLAAYDAAVAAPETEARIRADLSQGQQAGVSGTPSFVLNGRLFSGALSYESLKAQVDQALAGAAAPGGSGR